MRQLFCALGFVLASCATPSTPINTMFAAAPAPAAQSVRAAAGEDVIVLALSGGGARAASFGLGVLQGLHATAGRDGRPLTAHLALITAVSGGAVLAAHYGLHGEAGLETFRAAYLDKDWRLGSMAAPPTWWRAAQGGANARHADWLDREVYAGARMNAMAHGPRVIINAADLANATPFAFTPMFFAGVCSDLGDVRVADAVAASMAVPVIFRPVLLQTHRGGACAEPDWVGRALADRSAPETASATARALREYRRTQDYVHLTDGGVFDNFGLASLAVERWAEPAPAPFSARDAVMARRILFLVVNSEYEREIAWPNRATSPNGPEAMISALDAATEAGKRGALDALRASLDDIQRELVTFRCALEPRTRRELGAPTGWACGDLSVALEVISLRDAGPDAPDDLIRTPTLVSLPGDRVTALIAAGRYAVTHNDAVRSMAE